MHLTAFTRRELENIHEASLQILSSTGVVYNSKEVLEMFRRHGAVIENDTVLIPPDMVMQALQTAPAQFVMRARNDAKNLTIGSGELAVQPNIGPIYVYDLDGKRRESVFDDFVNMQKLAQSSTVVNLVGSSPVEPGDLPQQIKHLHMMYAVLKHTDKPVIGLAGHQREVRRTLEMMRVATAPFTTEEFREHHWIGVAVNPLSPLTFSPDALETILCYAAMNQPIFIPPAIMAGVTGPIDPLGTVILQNTEVLAGVVLTQLINPGNPVVYTCASTAAYMKNASFVTGTPEMALIHAGGIQMGKEYYNLPTRSLCGMSDSKSVDCQAGYESMASTLISVLAGTDMMVECMGCLESLMATSYDKFIIDEEVIARAICIKKGFDTSNAAIENALGIIKEVGRGNYLTHPSTFGKFRERWIPSVSDWESHDAKISADNQNIVKKARRKVKERLEAAPMSMVSQKQDDRLAAFLEEN